MSQWIRRGVSRLFRLSLRRPAQAADEMDAELRFHLEARIEHLVARGMSPEAARAEALRRLGADPEQARIRLRQSAQRREQRLRLLEWLQDLGQDLRYAGRGLLRRPGFTALAVLTLALGIGATTAIWSAVNALLLRPLPFREPGRLMRLSLLAPRPAAEGGPVEAVWSYPKFGVFRDAQREFSNLALYTRGNFTLTGGEPERVVGEGVSANYLPTLGIDPMLGRSFLAEEGVLGGRRVVIVGHALWQRRFSADPAVIGQTLIINRQPYEIVGVTPVGFGGLTGQAEVFIPFTTLFDPAELNEPYSHSFYLVGRLRPGVSAAQAEAAATLHGARVHQAFTMGAGFAGAQAWSARAAPLDATRVSPVVRRSLLILLGAVAFVLLIACANLANLLLGRAATRRREIAVRLAIGAGRGRLVRLLLAESGLLAAVGGAVSLLVAWWGVSALSGMNPADTLRVQGIEGLGPIGFSAIRLDGAALRFALAVALLVGVLFGLAPALQSTRPRLTEALKDGETGSRLGGIRGLSSRRVLVVLEMALALVLLAGSGLMIRSLAKLMRVHPGFEAKGLLTFRLTLPSGALARDSLPGFYSQLLARLSALPGVSGAGLGDCPPLAGGCNITGLEFMDRPRVPNSPMRDVGIHWITPEWFSVLQVPLLRGRLFEPTDRLGGPRVIVISEATARRDFPGQDPLGRRIGVGQGGFHEGAEIVGIVGDVRFGRIDAEPVPEVYIPYPQSPQSRMLVFLRTAGSPSALAGPARAVVRELAPDAPVYDLQTMSERAARSSAQTRFAAGLLALFSAVALALAVIGIYGVMSFAVTQRSRELGIRMALGADRRDVLGLVLREGMVLGVIGAVLGLAGAFALTRVLRGLLYGVTPSDPATYAAMLLVLGAAALLASWLPARRAARVDPTVSLKAE